MAYEGITEVTSRYEDEISLDSDAASSLLWSKPSRNKANALLEPNDKAESNKAHEWKDKAFLNARSTVMCEEFWEDFVLMAKVCVLRDKEADLFDVFDTIRTKVMGGWGFTPEFLVKMDAEIEHDYQKELKRGRRTA